MSALVPLPIVLPLLGAALCLLAWRWPGVQRVIATVTLAAVIAIAATTLATVVTDGTQVVRIGGTAPVIGIVLVADRLAALLTVVGTGMLGLVLVYAFGQRGPDQRSRAYHPAYLVLSAGVSAAFLAGDLFHLFVAVEVLLIASYVLLMLEGNDAQIRAGTTYVVINILESTILLTAIGLVFAATGTVSMALLPERLAALPDGVRWGLNGMLFVAFGLKAAVFPLFSWLPDSYPTAPSPVTAVFAGLLTKIGVYALIRTETLLFPGGQEVLLLTVASFTMVIGVLGALAQADMKRILSFHIVSQIGYMVLGLGIGTPAALAATVFFVVHQIPVKTSLFLVEGIVERETGTSRLADVGGLLHRSGWLAALFLIPALSLAGLPPLSGFVGKLGIVAALAEEAHWWLLGLALLVSLFTLVSMMKIWVGLFWGEVTPVPAAGAPVGMLRQNPVMTAATVVAVAAGLAVAAVAGPLYRFCRDIGVEIADPLTYVRAVVG